MVQWLELGAFIAGPGTEVQSLVGELISCKPSNITPPPKKDKIEAYGTDHIYIIISRHTTGLNNFLSNP